MDQGQRDQQDRVTPERASGPRAADEIVARLERLPFTRFHLHMAGTLAGGTFFSGFDLAAMGVALTVVLGALHLSPFQGGLLVSAAVLGQVAGSYLNSAVAEHLGRKRAFALTLIVFGLFSVGSGLAANFGSLFAFRFLQGVGLGGEVPIAAALFMECLRGHDRGKVVLLYQSAYAWGLFICPLVGFVVIATLPVTVSWRVLFLVGAVPLLLGLYALARLPESPRWLADRGRYAEADRMVEGMESSLRRRGHELEEPQIRHRADVLPTRWLELLSPAFLRRTIASSILMFVFGASYAFYLGWIPSFFVRLGGVSASEATLLVTLISAIQLVLAYVIALTIDRVGRMVMLRLGCALATGGSLVGLILVGILHQGTLAGLFVMALMIVLGCLCMGYVSTVWIPELFPTRMRAWAGSATYNFSAIANFVIPIVIGALIGLAFGPLIVFAILVAIAAIGLICMLTLGIETKQRVLEEIAEPVPVSGVEPSAPGEPAAGEQATTT